MKYGMRILLLEAKNKRADGIKWMTEPRVSVVHSFESRYSVKMSQPVISPIALGYLHWGIEDLYLQINARFRNYQ